MQAYLKLNNLETVLLRNIMSSKVLNFEGKEYKLLFQKCNLKEGTDNLLEVIVL